MEHLHQPDTPRRESGGKEGFARTARMIKKGRNPPEKWEGKSLNKNKTHSKTQPLVGAFVTKIRAEFQRRGWSRGFCWNGIALDAQAISPRINYHLKSFPPNFGRASSAGNPQEQNILTLSCQVTPGNEGLQNSHWISKREGHWTGWWELNLEICL